MAIIRWPHSIKLGLTVHCVTCGQEVALEEATAGLVSTDGGQAFACNSHFWSSSQLIRSWSIFSIEQEIKKSKGDDTTRREVS